MTGILEYLRDYRMVTTGGQLTLGNESNGASYEHYGFLTNGNF